MAQGARATRFTDRAMKDNQLQVWRQLAGLSSIGITFAAAIAIGAGIGIVLDRWLDTSPWFTILFFLFGVAAGFMNMLRDLKRWGR